MTEEEHLLCCLAEECAEVAQRVSKALRFGLDEIQPGQPLNNAERIVGEFVDLLAVMDELTERQILDAGDMNTRMAAHEAKRAKVRRYLEYSMVIATKRAIRWKRFRDAVRAYWCGERDTYPEKP